jgi:outer membrane protein OmpA-like peptidoglycan-associated protein
MKVSRLKFALSNLQNIKQQNLFSMKLYKKTAIASLIAFGAVSCATNPYTGEREINKSAIYGVAGAGAGALAGLASGKGAKGALIGAGIGGAAGGGYGYYKNIQEKKLREALQGTGVSIVKQGEQLTLVMPGNITFPSGQADLKASFYPTLNSIAMVLKEYKKTTLEIGGHTDSTGIEQKNMALSEQRADSVAQYLINQGISSSRIVAHGNGSSKPIASNASEAGRQKNRRIEIKLLTPNQ